MKQKIFSFIRYPGGKQRILNHILSFLPKKEQIKGKYIEPFLGSGAVFFALNPKFALLSDINPELIDLFRGIRISPNRIWEIYKSFPKTKEAYYKIRALKTDDKDLVFRAARTLYLNRTCFKGMWRHNSKGQFNVGYGGQDRRWVINVRILKETSKILKNATLKCSDFEKIINKSEEGDFMFLDPPYKPGDLELEHSHYLYSKFKYSDYCRLAESLKKASDRNVKWALTISSHPKILNLFKENQIIFLPKGTGNKPGILTLNSAEVLICNY